MKAAGFLIVALSLIAGILGAVTAYLPLLTLSDDRLAGLTLNAAAGSLREGTNAVQPLVKKGTTLAPEHLTLLRRAGVKRIRVKEFAFARWTGRNLFIFGTAGLLLGGLMVRRAEARPVPAIGGETADGDPEPLLKTIQQQIEQLRNELRVVGDDEERRGMILERLGRLQRVEVPLFVATRSVMVNRLSLSGYARVMDRFSAGERQMNRAWSAAADGVLEESMDCLQRVGPLFAETARLLNPERE